METYPRAAVRCAGTRNGVVHAGRSGWWSGCQREKAEFVTFNLENRLGRETAQNTAGHGKRRFLLNGAKERGKLLRA
jgi:hypothetical protein